MLRVLDLFSGIGGFSLGLERAGMTTVAFCEIDPFCRAVLRKHWPEVPCYDDVRGLTAARLDRDGIGRVDVVTGGYPCQPFSHAGRRTGEDDPRHLWPAMRRLVGEVRPAWVVAENVAGHITLGLDQVLADLEADGYAGRAIVVPAAAVDAPHIRQRVWIVARDRNREPTVPVDAEMEGMRGDMADADGEPVQAGRRSGDVGSARACEGEGEERQRVRSDVGECSGSEQVADANRERREIRLDVAGGSRNTRRASSRREAGEPHRWIPEPDVGRVAAGIPNRVDRLRALGNAVVPQVVEVIGRAILQEAGAC